MAVRGRSKTISFEVRVEVHPRYQDAVRRTASSGGDPVFEERQRWLGWLSRGIFIYTSSGVLRTH
jgi:hypothetical protein